jgi:hypothetical protein
MKWSARMAKSLAQHPKRSDGVDLSGRPDGEVPPGKLGPYKEQDSLSVRESFCRGARMAKSRQGNWGLKRTRLPLSEGVFLSGCPDGEVPPGKLGP